MRKALVHPTRTVLLETMLSDVSDIMICSCERSTALLYAGMAYRLRGLRVAADEPGYGPTDGCCCGVYACTSPSIFAMLRRVQNGGGEAQRLTPSCTAHAQLQSSQTTIDKRPTPDHSSVLYPNQGTTSTAICPTRNPSDPPVIVR